MEHLGANKIPKNPDGKYHCNYCNYTTSHLGDWNKHLMTAKHQKLTSADSCKLKCACGQTFKHRQSIYRHKKACKYEETTTPKIPKIPDLLISAPKSFLCSCGKNFTRVSNLKRHQKTCSFIQKHDHKSSKRIGNSQVIEMFGSLNAKLEQTCIDNKLLKEKLTQLESGVMTAVSEPKTVNNYNNIVFLLNEKCSDAIAISDFAKQIVMQIEDVDYAMENGKVRGIENIIRRKFEELGTFKRPMHCTDVKRGTLYVKNEEGWEKEKGEINKMIRDVECAQSKGIKVWSDANPEYSQGDSRLMDKWIRIVQCLTGSIEGIGMRKIEKRVQEMCKIDNTIIA